MRLWCQNKNRIVLVSVLCIWLSVFLFAACTGPELPEEGTKQPETIQASLYCHVLDFETAEKLLLEVGVNDSNLTAAHEITWIIPDTLSGPGPFQLSITHDLQLKCSICAEGFSTLELDSTFLIDSLGKPWFEDFRYAFAGNYRFQGIYKRWRYAPTATNCDVYDSLEGMCYWVDSMDYVGIVKLLVQPVACLAELNIQERLVIDFSREPVENYHSLLCYNLLQWYDRVVFPTVNAISGQLYTPSDTWEGIWDAGFRNDTLFIKTSANYKWDGVECDIYAVKIVD